MLPTIGSIIKENSTNKEYIVLTQTDTAITLYPQKTFLLSYFVNEKEYTEQFSLITLGDEFDEIHFKIMLEYFTHKKMGDYYSKYKAVLS